MSYAEGRRTLDADSHLMELPGVLDRYLEDGLADRLNNGVFERVKAKLDKAVAQAEQRGSDPDARASAEERLLLDKGWDAMGAFDPAERRRVLDLFGFDGQLVFATFAAFLFAGPDHDLLYAGARAHNRWLADFCREDRRMLPVAFVPLVDPERAAAAMEEAIDLGCAAVHVPSTAAGELAPTHPDLHRVWAVLNEARVPFVLHIGGGGRLLDRRFHNNGMPVSDHLGGGENVRSKDFLAISHSPAIFLGTLVLDGLFDRFPNLRGAAIEEGAGWVVSWLYQLDHAQRSFQRTEPPLARLELKPSEYVHRHLKFTPFSKEPVGWMMEQAGSDLFMFSTDYPHPEGGRDPRGEFEATMTGVSEADRERFYYGNMAELLGPALVPA